MHHNYIDHFAQGDSPVHRLDGRAKLLAVLAYTAVLISFGRYEVTTLVPMAALPLVWLAAGRVPMWFALRRVLVLSPFVAMLCLAGPLYDHAVRRVAVGTWQFEIDGGWLTAADIAVKFTLGLLALTAMMCTTPFSLLLEAMRRLRVPKLLVMQLGFLYRYIFVLLDESMRVRRGRDFRGAARAPASRRLAAVGGIVGALFVRTLERSERVHTAMCARGYRGEPHSLGRLSFHGRDAAFLTVVAAYLVACRAVPFLLAG
ncbi:MAG: cobalt ECF transporter T component CbiQ [Phycisphaerae bacterium]